MAHFRNGAQLMAAGRALPLAAVAWDNYQGRTQALADALGGRAWYIRSWPRQKLALPLRYLIDGIRMWRLLQAHRPRALLVVTPPVVPPVVAWWWCLTHPCRLVVDCHTGAFHSWKWRWTGQLLRLVCRKAVATLVHTTGDEDLVRAWGATPLLLPDDVPDLSQADLHRHPATPFVVVAGSLDGNEPVAAALNAAKLLPEVEVRFTGDPHRVPPAVRRAAPGNVVFTGWLAYPQFLGELVASQVVAVFSTDPHIMNRAAFEAIGLGRPLVLSDLPGRRARVGEAAVFSPNEPEAMAEAIRLALHEHEELAMKSTKLQSRLRAQHQQALARLMTTLEAPDRFSPAPTLRVRQWAARRRDE